MNKKNLKSLLQNKQKIIGRATGYPAISSGRDGDFQVRRIPGQGIFLFYNGTIDGTLLDLINIDLKQQSIKNLLDYLLV